MVNTLCERLKATELENEELQVELKSMGEVVGRGKKCLVVKPLTSKYLGSFQNNYEESLAFY